MPTKAIPVFRGGMNGSGKLLTASRLLRGRSFLTPLRSNITDGENRYFYYCTVPGEWITLLLRSYLFCMGKYFDMLMEDVRMREGLHSCMNCGVCTGVCPAAEFYNYDPRQIVNIVQTKKPSFWESVRSAWMT
jgi:ferredoxin